MLAGLLVLHVYAVQSVHSQQVWLAQEHAGMPKHFRGY